MHPVHRAEDSMAATVFAKSLVPGFRRRHDPGARRRAVGLSSCWLASRFTSAAPRERAEPGATCIPEPPF
eukprot:7006526-Alexandrium_andersonii.AAC.1